MKAWQHLHKSYTSTGFGLPLATSHLPEHGLPFRFAGDRRGSPLVRLLVACGAKDTQVATRPGSTTSRQRLPVVHSIAVASACLACPIAIIQDRQAEAIPTAPRAEPISVMARHQATKNWTAVSGSARARSHAPAASTAACATSSRLRFPFRFKSRQEP